MFNFNLFASKEDYNNTQVENGNIALETSALFKESVPYILNTNIFGENTYKWNEDFISNMNDTLNGGEYSLSFNKTEKILAQRYIDFKFGPGASDEVIDSLDAELG